MKIFAVGASRNIGYHTATGLLKQGHTVIFLLRNPSTFDNDETIKQFVQSNKATLVKGDATVPEDVKRAWNQASADGPVDAVVFTVGCYPTITLTGINQIPANLCTNSLLNVLSVVPRSSPQPRVVAITCHGVTKSTHWQLPLLVKGLYSFISVPHADKLGIERVMDYSGGWASWSGAHPKENILPPGWEAQLGGKEGWLKSVAIVRPCLLMDGEETGKYRAGENLKGLWTVNRKDVAHFIFSDLLPNWSKYEGKAISVGY